jgi:hypothetical protein
VAELRELWEALHRNTAQFADLFGRALPAYDLVAPTPAAVLEELGLSVPGGATAGGASGAGRLEEFCVMALNQIANELQYFSNFHRTKQVQNSVRVSSISSRFLETCFLKLILCDPPLAPSPAPPAAADELARQMFEDDDARAFYQSLPDLRATMPAVLFEDAPPLSVSNANANAMAVDQVNGMPADGGAGVNGQAEVSAEDAAASMGDAERTLEQLTAAGGANDDADDVAGSSSSSSAAASLTGERRLSALDAVFESMTVAYSREAVDEAAERFCHVNNKASRRRLLRETYALHRNDQVRVV